MCNLKYIVFDTGEFVVFSKHIMHADIFVSGHKPVSAGFVVGLPGDKFKCTGRSESLDLNCRDEDTDLINKAFEGATFPDY